MTGRRPPKQYAGMPVSEAHAAAHQHLMDTIERASNPVPCLTGGTDWINSHPRVATAAAQKCATCPVQEVCRDYGAQFETTGVWGGIRVGRETVEAQPLFDMEGIAV